MQRSKCPCSPYLHVHTCVKAPPYDRLIAHGREWASTLWTKGSGGFHTHGTLEPPVSGAGHTLQLEALCAKPTGVGASLGLAGLTVDDS